MSMYASMMSIFLVIIEKSCRTYNPQIRQPNLLKATGNSLLPAAPYITANRSYIFIVC